MTTRHTAPQARPSSKQHRTCRMQTTNNPHHSRLRATSRPWRRLSIVAAGSLAALIFPTGCAPDPTFGPTPKPSAPFTAAPSTANSHPAARPSDPNLYKLNVIINARTVTPLRRSVHLARGRTVVLTLHSDHDLKITIDGPGIDRSVYIDRSEPTVPASFVANHPGVITVASTSPEATIARFIVS